MGTLYIRGILGSVSQVNLEKILQEDNADNFQDSKTLQELESIFKSEKYHFDYKSTDEGDFFTFGRDTQIGAEFYSGWFGHLNHFLKEAELPTEEESQEIDNALHTVLNSLPEKYEWVKKLNWSKPGIYLRVSS